LLQLQFGKVWEMRYNLLHYFNFGKSKHLA
jgi:hypothetical protein